jgi:hypothetical protein
MGDFTFWILLSTSQRCVRSHSGRKLTKYLHLYTRQEALATQTRDLVREALLHETTCLTDAIGKLRIKLIAEAGLFNTALAMRNLLECSLVGRTWNVTYCFQTSLLHFICESFMSVVVLNKRIKVLLF